MKNYFDFTLTGKKFLPIWLLFLVFFIAPYATLIITLRDFQPGDKPPLLFFLLLLLIIVGAFILTFYIAKLAIEGIVYKDKAMVFNGGFGEYIGTVLLGGFLSIITLGVYASWFIRNMQRFFINNSSHDSQPLTFNGKGGKLFLIILLTVFLPMILLMVVMSLWLVSVIQTPMIAYLVQIVTTIILVPYIYYVYKWMVDVSYKGYHISWHTDFWASSGKIALEVILIMVTLGIYSPLAMVRLYKYFAERTMAISADDKLRFGYDIDQLNDFLFIWGQILLSIVTLGIYYPWAFCKIGKRVLGKTYVEKS